MTCGSQGCFDVYQTGDHHHIVTSNSATSLTITYGKGDTLGAWHPNSPWTCTCTAASCAKLVGTFKCSADFYGSTSLEIGLSSGAYTFEPACVDPACMSLDVRTCASPPPPSLPPPSPPPPPPTCLSVEGTNANLNGQYQHQSTATGTYYARADGSMVIRAGGGYVGGWNFCAASGGVVVEPCYIGNQNVDDVSGYVNDVHNQPAASEIYDWGQSGDSFISFGC